MHNFEQVKDVIHYGKTTHAGLQTLYAAINACKQQTRVSMLLDFLSQHERQCEKALVAFEQGGNAHILDTWMQYAPSVDIAHLINSIKVRSEMSVDDVIEMVVTFNNALMQLYQEAAMETDIPRAKEVFENLRYMEGNESMRVMRDALMLQDI